MHSLAVSYRDSGHLDRAIPLLEQTLKAEQVKLGEAHLQTLLTQRSLALAYQSARRYSDAEALFREAVRVVGRIEPRNDRFYSVTLELFGRCLIHEKKFAEAVSILREYLALKEKAQPDDWTTAEARSLLGEALAGQRSFQEAERLLLAGQDSLVKRREKIPVRQRDASLYDSVARLMRLYEAWKKPAQADNWKTRLPPAPANKGSQRGTDGMRQL
jgi:tetratricopeptide (TPR) repeat protein